MRKYPIPCMIDGAPTGAFMDLPEDADPKAMRSGHLCGTCAKKSEDKLAAQTHARHQITRDAFPDTQPGSMPTYDELVTLVCGLKIRIETLEKKP